MFDDMTSLRTTHPLLALFAVVTLAAGCADDESPIGGLDEEGESEGEGEGGEDEGGEELGACLETVTVLADADTETPEGYKASEIIARAVGTHELEFGAAEVDEGVSILTSVPVVLKVELAVGYDSGEVRYIDSVPSDGSEATCVPRIEADLVLKLVSDDEFFATKLNTVLVSHINEEGLEAPMITNEIEDLGELGTVELVEIEPADPTALSYELGFVFTGDGVVGELRGMASYEDAGIDGDVVVSALGFKLFVFSQ